MSLITQGTQASASVLNSALASISSIGQNALTTILAFKQINLLLYQNVQSYVNSRRVLSNRAKAASIPLTISAGDFACIDQGLTTGSIRGDAGVITTKENNVEFTSLTDFTFTASAGTVNALDNSGQLFTVISSVTPTGQFDIPIGSSVDCSLITFDVMANPGNTQYQVFVSSDQITYTQWTNISVNGYRITTFGNTANTNYIRIVMIPGAPDQLSGENYSFGLTSLVVRASQFALRSEFNSRAFTISPISANLFFGADTNTGLTHYVSISSDGSGQFTQTTPNTLIPIPGVTQLIANSSVSLVSGKNLLSTTLPGNVYIPSIKIQETTSSTPVVIPVIPGLSSTDPNLTTITKDCIYISGSNLYLLTPTALTGRTFVVSYYTGPENIVVKVKVVLDTSSYGYTPMFNQVYFEAA